MAVNNVYQLVLTSVGVYAEAINVFWYNQVSGTTPQTSSFSEDLFTAFRLGIVDVLASIMADEVTIVGAKVVNYATPTDFFEGNFAVPEPGARTGQMLGDNNCYSFKSSQPFPGQRRAFKRFIGVSEDDQANGVADADMFTLFSDVSDSLSGNAGLSTSIFQPVIVPRAGLVLGTNPTSYNATNWSYNGISTQNSRRKAPIA